MNISTKGRYGLRAMIDMAINYNGEYMPLKLIASRQEISEQYLEHVFYMLKKANLVKSIRGSQGGYMLSKAPSKITVGNVLRALEGEMNIKGLETNNTIEQCIDAIIWQSVNDRINTVFDSITLDLLVEEYKRINENYKYDFVI